ncbi:MAG: gliding motility-associated C-terminal domain-containing protein [Saprospiraceae bacterium]|nr:gliding motility-associated C-terminal domain-containing protein [Saprospiraceae bacterium]MDW8228846.1 gliding motility-associated C-terminal domain-containing protein [Saprospiraceae bacterium]
MKKYLLLLPLMALSQMPAWATHIVGGEITYRCLGNDQYEINLTVYRDCFNGVPWFDNPASIGVYDAQWNLVRNLFVSWNPAAHDTLPVALDNPCLVVPPNVCVHRSTYRAITTLPFRPGGYTLVYQRCCRNKLIRNLPNPLNTGISIIATLSEATLLQCNNSAVFNKWPPVAICVNEPINFDHSATDRDGDSLVYRLCTPLNGPDSLNPQPSPPLKGPYPEVVWLPPYNLGNVLGGDPLAIHPATGFMTGIPNTIGNFVVGVCVDEYRNGALISTTRRDFQYNVAECGYPTAAFAEVGGACENEVVRFINQSNFPSVRWYFDWPNDLTKTTTVYSPTYQFPDTGTYTIALIVGPGLPCADTAFQTIRVGAFSIDAAMKVEFPQCNNDGLVIRATDQSKDTLYGVRSWSWQLTGAGGFSLQSSAQNPTFVVKRPGNYQLRLIALSEGGCRDTALFTFNAPIPIVDSLRRELTICPGDSVRLNRGGIPTYTYQWSPASTLSDPTAASPWAFPKTNTTYRVTITNAFCTYEGLVTVNVFDVQDFTVTADPEVIYLGGQSQLQASYGGTGTLTWTPTTGLSNPNIPNPIAKPNGTTTYVARLRLDGGCTLTREITITVLFPRCDEPFVFFPTGFSPNGDNQNDVLRLESRFVEEVYWAIYNRWGQKLFETNDPEGFWDGTFQGKPQPVETYGYYLRVRCPGGTVTEKKGNVMLLR